MKNFKILLISFLLIGLSANSRASHTVGGEISWTCMNNGQFVFHLTLYRDCQNSPSTTDFRAKAIYIRHSATIGINYPRSNAGVHITAIPVLPDSAKWIAMQYGDISPVCVNGNPISCANADRTVQAYYYSSAPINLNGIPPASGWHFYHSQDCCRYSLTNINSNNNPLFKSSMYPIPIPNTNPQQFYTTNNCIDQSPVFTEKPNLILCRGIKYHINNYALDDSVDSLSFSFVPLLTGTPSNPATVNFINGYSLQFPLPNYFTDTLNDELILDGNNGNLQFGEHKNLNSLKQRFSYSIGVDSYRYGVKIASVQREMMLEIRGCLTASGLVQNQSPRLLVLGTLKDTVQINLNVGHTLNFPLLFRDIDYDSSSVPPFQSFFIQPIGSDFSTDFTNDTLCSNPPCAKISPLPTFNSNTNRYEVLGQDSLGVQLFWQPDTNHLTTDGKAKEHFFHFVMRDDQCPIPGQSTATIIVRVHPFGTSIKETNSSYSSIDIYPNPTKGDVRIKLNNTAKNIKLRLLSPQGKLLKEMSFQNQIEINYLIEEKPGLYFLEIQVDGKLKETKKVLKI